MTKVYSPSSTVNWCRCPVLWQLQREYEPRMMGKPALARILGTGVAAGLARYYKERKDYMQYPSAKVGVDSVNKELQALLAQGHEVYDSEKEYANKLPLMVSQAITKYIDKDPIPASWKVLQVEEALPSGSRPDLVCETPSGEIIVIDWKVKRSLDSRYFERTLAEYRDSWQLRHYLWELGKVMSRSITQYGIVLILLEPTFKVHYEPVQIDLETLERWEWDAHAIWTQMEAMEKGELRLYGSPDHYDRYGQCPFYKACLDYKLEPALMETEYIKKEPRHGPN